jgi:hypothetical protein
MYKLKRLVAPLASVASILALSLVAVSSALAGQPVTQSLSPPPPPWLTCKAVGTGTICEGTVSYSYSGEDTGIACGSGAGSFEILDSATVTDRDTDRYDANGQLVEVLKHETYSSGQFSNSGSGAAVPYTSNVTTTITFPGTNALLVFRGEMNLTAPGLGAVALNAGRLVDLFNDQGDNILFEAGPHSLFPDLYLYGDTSVVPRLCAALGGTA